MATLSRISVYPIKALDPMDLDSVSITEVGGLSGDRIYAIVDENGNYVNGKRTAKVHRLDAEVHLEQNHLTLRERGRDAKQQFHLDDDREQLDTWLSEYFGIDVHLEHGPGGSQTDSVVLGDSNEPGPTLISEATLRKVASWYDGIDAEEMRLRLRPNLVVTDVPAFWEDKLVGTDGRCFRVGDTTLEGVKPVPRCVVPTRDPATGETYDGFRETFVQKREETLPEWTSPELFDGDLFSLMALTRVPEDQRGSTLAVGDSLTLADTAVDGS